MFHDSPAISLLFVPGGYHVMRCASFNIRPFPEILVRVPVCHTSDWLPSPSSVLAVSSRQIPPRLVLSCNTCHILSKC